MKAQLKLLVKHLEELRDKEGVTHLNYSDKVLDDLKQTIQRLKQSQDNPVQSHTQLKTKPAQTTTPAWQLPPALVALQHALTFAQVPVWYQTIGTPTSTSPILIALEPLTDTQLLRLAAEFLPTLNGLVIFNTSLGQTQFNPTTDANRSLFLVSLSMLFPKVWALDNIVPLRLQTLAPTLQVQILANTPSARVAQLKQT